MSSSSWQDAALEAMAAAPDVEPGPVPAVQLALPVRRPRSRRRRLLEQFDEHDERLGLRDLVRSVELMLGSAPIARGRRWPRAYERT